MADSLVLDNPIGLSEFRDSSKQISQDDIETFYRAQSFYAIGDCVTAKMLYIELLKKSYLRSNYVILNNIDICNKEIS